MEPRRGKDDHRTCTREILPQTAAVGRFPGPMKKSDGTLKRISALCHDREDRIRLSVQQRSAFVSNQCCQSAPWRADPRKAGAE